VNPQFIYTSQADMCLLWVQPISIHWYVERWAWPSMWKCYHKDRQILGKCTKLQTLPDKPTVYTAIHSFIWLLVQCTIIAANVKYTSHRNTA